MLEISSSFYSIETNISRVPGPKALVRAKREVKAGRRTNLSVPCLRLSRDGDWDHNDGYRFSLVHRSVGELSSNMLDDGTHMIARSPTRHLHDNLAVLARKNRIVVEGTDYGFIQGREALRALAEHLRNYRTTHAPVHIEEYSDTDFGQLTYGDDHGTLQSPSNGPEGHKVAATSLLAAGAVLVRAVVAEPLLPT